MPSESKQSQHDESYQKGYAQAIKDLNTERPVVITGEYDHTVCPQCGQDFSDIEDNFDGVPERAVGMLRCPHCGQRLDWERFTSEVTPYVSRDAESPVFKAFNIQWDTDGETVDGLPIEVIIPNDVIAGHDLNDQHAIADIVGDWLSDEYGYCHFVFQLERIRNEPSK